MALAGGAGRERAVVGDVDADLHVDVEAARVDAEDLREERLALQRVVLRHAAAEDPDARLAVVLAARRFWMRAHRVDVVRDVEPELEALVASRASFTTFR